MDARESSGGVENSKRSTTGEWAAVESSGVVLGIGT